MPPHAVVGLALLAVLVTTVIALVFSPRRKSKPAEPDVQPDIYDDPFKRYDPKPDLDEPFRRAAENVKKHPPVEAKYHPRPTVKSPALAAPYRRPTITLTPHQMERVNIQRKLRGKPALNQRGLSNAVAHARPYSRSDMQIPQSSNDWISYLIAYEVFSQDHRSPFITCGGVTIDPNAPYNGQGGEYGGAGASGDWDNVNTRATAAAIDHGVPLATDHPDTYADTYLVSNNPPLTSSETVSIGATGDWDITRTPTPDTPASDSSSSSSSSDSSSSSSSDTFNSTDF